MGSTSQSMQIVFALGGFFGLLAIYVLDRNDLWLEIQKGGAISIEMGYLVLVVTFFVVMTWFHLKYGRKQSGPSI